MATGGAKGLVSTAGVILLWITLSANCVMVNKYILSFSNFAYPVSLTLMHMVFSFCCSALIMKLGWCETVEMDMGFYLSSILPIAALFAGTLWLGNAAYVHLSVSMVQMLKAATPAAVFIVGLGLGTEKFSAWIALDLLVVGAGAAVAAYGEINFNALGLVSQIGAIISESFRLCLIQILLQSRGVKLNPITTLYYVAPACAACLTVPFSTLEFTKLMHSTDWKFPAGAIAFSAVSAFALNISIFLLIGKTSALTMNIAGFVKDWMLIGLSAVVYGAPITRLQLGGYAVTFFGICAYNMLKSHQARQLLAAQMQGQGKKEEGQGAGAGGMGEDGKQAGQASGDHHHHHHHNHHHNHHYDASMGSLSSPRADALRDTGVSTAKAGNSLLHSRGSNSLDEAVAGSNTGSGSGSGPAGLAGSGAAGVREPLLRRGDV